MAITLDDREAAAVYWFVLWANARFQSPLWDKQDDEGLERAMQMLAAVVPEARQANAN